MPDTSGPSGSPDDSAGATSVVPAAEVALLVAIQQALVRPSASGRQRRAVMSAARGLSHFGEHSIGWFAAGLVGAAIDRRRRGQWLTAAASVVGAHAASIVVKRVVRRRRPQDPAVEVGVATPSRLSFPSSHATSTTAAAVVYSKLTGRTLVPVVVPPMLASRLVLGVHYPTDVLAGAALGGAIGAIVRRGLAGPS
ncbi:phosphatase PAP2 family protein [Haloechinothrix salitolerans]|uniref:Phosphatase PAP2 family protein n=1 Tax=Haloechinothrix salitolerans TaxID=926830 RepID=A0ABW2C921_9PSEU